MFGIAAIGFVFIVCMICVCIAGAKHRYGIAWAASLIGSVLGFTTSILIVQLPGFADWSDRPTLVNALLIAILLVSIFATVLWLLYALLWASHQSSQLFGEGRKPLIARRYRPF